MPIPNNAIDFIAYDPEGAVVLLAEAKSRRGTSAVWAAKFRRNMLAHGLLPRSKYFLIATPERMYGWKQENLTANDVPPQFTVDAQMALAPYFTKLNQDPDKIEPAAFEFLFLTWLTDVVTSANDNAEVDPSLKSLFESGLLSSLRHAQIEMNRAA